MNPRRHRRLARQRGFSFIELLISLAILVLLLLGTLQLFDFSSKTARAQTHVANMQQSVRVANYQLSRQTRMAGRGGLPAFLPAGGLKYDGTPYTGKLLPAGAAIEVRPNVAAGSTIAIGDASSPTIVTDTDVLTVRGLFGPLFDVNFEDSTTWVVIQDGLGPTTATLRIDNRVKTSSQDNQQTLAALEQVVNEVPFRPEALLLTSTINSRSYTIAEITGGAATTVGSEVTTVTLNLAFRNASGGTYADLYLNLSPGGVVPPTFTTPARVGILEEVRYYIRDTRDAAGDLVPVLSVAHFYPGTEVAYASSAANLRDDLADNITDLQVALGIDSNANGLIEEAALPINRSSDDWLLNHAADDFTSPAGIASWNATNTPLFYVRINAVARTDRPDRLFVAEPITAIEDHAYNEPAVPATEADRVARMHRRRQLQTLIETRNL